MHMDTGSVGRMQLLESSEMWHRLHGTDTPTHREAVVLPGNSSQRPKWEQHSLIILTADDDSMVPEVMEHHMKVYTKMSDAFAISHVN
ncbi:hypothetical protein FOA52_013462 [Chlamydomonas sp. UWO 241]|nr:hypothetical protein FOA52_013462 [Chlamydomonas sp. UWO 241]